MSGALRTLRTLQHLTPGQVYARAVHELRQGVYRGAGPLLGLLYAPDKTARIARVRLALPETALEHKREAAERWCSGRVEYLGSEGDRKDWHASGRPKLWRYERQYHSELPALAALSVAEPAGPWLGEARALLEDWWTSCPPGPGDAWEPYPVARRILNWSLAAALAPELGGWVAAQLAMQLRFLRSHLERHLLGNHLLCDAAALVAGAAILDIGDAPEIGAFGSALLATELRRQLLTDGGYAERTAQYHALVLRDALVAVGLARLAGRAIGIEPELDSMGRWLSLVRRRESALPYLNDATPDAILFAREAASLGGALGFGWAGEDEDRVMGGDLLLHDTGWSIVRQDGHELLLEHGPIGPPEQPGHGHSDALSYELWWAGVPLVTDSGVTTYELGHVRDFERSARAHATVTVDGDGPDELWASFRVGGRGRVEAQPSKALVVLDRVRNARPGSEILSRLPLDPEWSFDLGPRTAAMRGPRELGLTLTILEGELAGASVGATSPREGWVGRGFGRPVPRPSLRFRADGAGLCSYAITAPGVILERHGRRCTLRSATEALDVPLDVDGSSSEALPA